MKTRDDILLENPLVNFLQAQGVKLIGSGKQLVTNSCAGTEHGSKHLCVSIDSDRQLWHCNDCKIGGTIIDWMMIQNNQTAADVLSALSGESRQPDPKPSGQPSIKAIYEYLNESREMVYQVVRMEPKTFRQRRPDGAGGWIWNMEGVTRILFNLPDVVAAKTVVVVEGEKDAMTAGRFSMVGTCNVGGSGKWLNAYSPVLAGKDIIIIPDNDPPGRKHGEDILTSISDCAGSVKVVVIPSPYKDLTDYVESFPSIEIAERELRALIEKTAHTVKPLPIYSIAEMEAQYRALVQQPAQVTFNLGNFLPALGELIAPMVPGEMLLFLADTGVGKCLGHGTPVLMHDGSVNEVQKISAGDILMGPDSEPRTVLSTSVGHGELYRITPRNGDSFVCNGDHILSLKKTGCWQTSKTGGRRVYSGGQLQEITVEEYLKKSNRHKHLWKLWKSPVEFSESKPPIPPYIVGAWLGDGSTSHPELTTGDIEIENEFRRYAKSIGGRITEYLYQGCKSLRLVFGKPERNQGNCKAAGCKNPSEARGLCHNHYEQERYHKRIEATAPRNVFIDGLRDLGILHHKRIPTIYLTGSSKQRMELLAGLIDTDGYCPKRSVAIFTNTNKRLADDVLYLARSLGFMCSIKPKKTSIKSTGFKGLAWNVTICGDTLIIPTRLKRRRKTGTVQRKYNTSAFTVEPIGRGDYYGFKLSGDGLFLLGDFTVTHNTMALQNMVRAASPLPSLLFELELPLPLVFERFVQMEIGCLRSDVQNEYREQHVPLHTAYAGLRHITVCPESGLSVDQIEQYIVKSELKIGCKPAVVAVDYIGLIRHLGSKNRYEAISNAAEQLKVIAKRTNVIMLVASQIGRPDKKKDDITVGLHDGRDSGALENSAGIVIGAWRPERTRMLMKILKSTSGTSGDTVEARVEGSTMRITATT